MRPSDVKRLAFIKYLLDLANHQSLLPEPTSSVSVLMFHDAVELFLQLTCEHLNISVPDNTLFLKYWDLIAAQRTEPFPQKEAMKRLNKSRVGLKHHGNLVSKIDVEAFRAVTNSFFAESVPLIFPVELGEISLVDFVNESNAREYLQEATALLSQGELNKALAKTAIAFHSLIDDYDTRKHDSSLQSPFYFPAHLRLPDAREMGLDKSPFSHIGEANHAARQFERNLGEFVDRAKEGFESMQRALRILAMGIDYPRYSKFLLIAPYVSKSGAGQYFAAPTDVPHSNQDVQFCIDFVIETALKLQDFDYTVVQH